MKSRIKLSSLLYGALCMNLALWLSGCTASANRLNKLRVGMSRDEVTRSIGRPRSTTAKEGTEIMIYQFRDKPFGDGMIFPGTYYVQLSQGRVTGWSRDEEKDKLDRERAFRMNYGGLGHSAEPISSLQPSQKQSATNTDLLTLLEGCIIVAHDGQVLGRITVNEVASDSILNEVGKYGSQVSSTSIFNEVGKYGGEVSSQSPFNEVTSTPPQIVNRSGQFVAYLTKNPVKTPAVDPHLLIGLLRSAR